MDRRHLIAAAGALAAAPGFAFAETPMGAAVRLNMTTAEGLLVLELFAEKAPLTAANFLRYVDSGRYDKSTFYRAVTAGNSTTLGLVQGGARMLPGAQIPPVPHEPTSQTGLAHTDGMLSLARLTPGSGTSDFFICCGDNRYLDANPAAQGDNAGFAVFGRVAEGMDIVRRILVMEKSQEAEVPSMRGQMLLNPVPILSTKRA